MTEIRPVSDPVVEFENRFVKVTTTPVTFPSGATGNYSVLTSGAGLGAIVVPTTTVRGINYLGLVWQYRFPQGQRSLEFPRGGTSDLNANEAGRELMEETGLVPDSMRRLGTLRPDTGVMDTEVSVWRAGVKAFDGILERDVNVNDETSSLLWVTHGQFAQMVSSQKITCGMTLAAYTLLNIG